MTKPLIELGGGKLKFPDLFISKGRAIAKAKELLEEIPRAVRYSVNFARELNEDRSMDCGYAIQLHT